jgi:NitT/TauT family transport system substrate-binding protein
MLGRTEAKAFASGAGFSGKFLETRPDVAKRYAEAWGRAVLAIRSDPSTREVLTSHLNTPADLAAIMPLQAFTLVRELTPADRTDMQRFVDLAVQQGVVREKIEVDRFLRAL